MKKLIRHRKGKNEMDITPLLDVMFMLLLFFLLTSSFLNPSISLKLPEAANKKVEKNQNIIVSVDKDGTIYCNREAVTIDTLPNVLKKNLSNSKKKNVIFKGDENLIYKKFISVLNIIKSSGAKEINIAHDPAKN